MTNETKNESQPTPVKTKTLKERFAWGAINTPLIAADTATAYLKGPINECLSELTLELQKQVHAVNKGDMSTAEGLLVSQAHTLNMIYNRLVTLAIGQQSADHLETLLKLGLRAQSQCARTLEVLSAVKNPSNVAFVKQANIANNQQVNNGVQASPTPASKTQVIDSTPQLEHTHGNYLDQGTTATAIRNDQDMGTVAKIHRTKDRRRKS